MAPTSTSAILPAGSTTPKSAEAAAVAWYLEKKGKKHLQS